MVVGVHGGGACFCGCLSVLSGVRRRCGDEYGMLDSFCGLPCPAGVLVHICM